MNNVAKGFERDNNKEFRNFLGYAKGSAGEVRSMLYVAMDLNYLSKRQFDENYLRARNIITQIANFKKYLHNYAVKEKIENIKSFILQLIIIN
jgi:four helix bundle protein